MRNSGLMIYIDGDKKENLQINICTSIVVGFCVLFCFVLVVLLLDLKLLKTWKSKTDALDSSNILAEVLLEKIWHS